MVKSPKIRHSKPAGEPLTIDLSKDDVKRVEAQQAAEKPAQGDVAAAPAAGSNGPAAGSAASTGSTGTAGARPDTAEAKPSASASSASSASGPKVSASTPQPDKPASAAAFGRDAGKPGTTSGTRPAAESAAQPPRDAGPAAPRRTGTALFAGLLGGAIALGGAGAAWYGGLIQPPAAPAQPVPPVVADDAAVGGLRAEVESLRAALEELRATPPAAVAPDLSGVDARIEGLATLVEDLRAQLTALGDDAGGAAARDTAALDALRTALAALEARVAALPADGGADLAGLRQEIGGAMALARQASEAAAQAATAAAALAPRLDGIQNDLAALATQVADAAEKPGVALAIAASALKAAVDRGMPFTTELDTYAGLAPDTPEIAALRPFAATGVPTRVDIEGRFEAAASAMIAAGRAEDPNASFVDKLWASAISVVEVRPIGEVQGAEPAAVVARMEVALGRGDYARAIAEFDALPHAARDAGAGFMEEVRARQAADELVAKMLAAALKA